MELLRVKLPIELTNGNNGRTSTWYLPAKRRREYESILRYLKLARVPFKNTVSVTVIRILGNKQHFWDSSSFGRGNYKELEDALVAVGWFVDDSVKWIEETRFRQDGSRRSQGPAVEIIVELGTPPKE